MFNWFTIVAQIVNFLVLVVLLRVFLYKRIVAAMDARQRAIADAVHQAEQGKQEAERQVAEFREKSEELEQQRQKLIAEAREEADARRKEWTDQARAEVSALSDRWKQTLEEEKEQFLHQLRETAGQEVCTIAARALAELADAELERQVVSVFLRRLEALPDDRRNEMRQALSAEEQVAVACAFDLPDEDQRRITTAVGQLLDTEAPVQFQRDAKLVCGIRLQAGGKAVEWSLETYLDDLTHAFAQTLDDEGGEEQDAPAPSDQEES